MSDGPSIHRVLRFPEGAFLLVQSSPHTDGAPYFLPDGSDKAYLGYGGHEVLDGKHLHKLPTDAPNFKEYKLTYEFEDDTLIAARLTTPFQRSAGVAADAATVQRLNDALQNGALTLMKKQEQPYICRAAQFSDGRLLVLVSQDRENTIYVGSPGNLAPTDAQLYMQGGCSLYFRTGDGTKIDLPYGYGGPNGETPRYGNEFLGYINVRDRNDLAAFGITLPAAVPHLDPFSPALRGPQPG